MAFLPALGALLAAASLSSALPMSSNVARSNNIIRADNNTVAASWYANWHTDFKLEDISWSKYTHMTYSFA